MAISFADINKITMQELNKAYKAATEPGEPIAPPTPNVPLMYYQHPTKAAFIVEEDNKEYIVTYKWLEVNKMSLGEFWGKAPQEVKNMMLSTKQTSKLNTTVETLNKALPLKPKPKAQFASLQEMYDSAQPVKLKKGAAKTVGTSAAKLTFGGNADLQYQPLNLEIKNTTSAQDFKIYNMKTQSGPLFDEAAAKKYEELLESVQINWAEVAKQLPKKDK